MRDSIAILGSFQGNEIQFSERTVTCGPCSVLSGDIGTPGVTTDNSYKVILNIGLDTTAVLDAFRITGGRDDRSPSNSGNALGGGVYNGGSGAFGEGGNCSPVFRNCVIDNNYATWGAGMFNNGHNNGRSAPILRHCILAFNHAAIGGGGMDSYGWNNGDVAPELYNCIFYGNTSSDRAGAMYCWGGLNGNCTPVIINSAFINNTSVNIAGGIIVDNSNDIAGNPPFTGTAEVTTVNSIFRGNTSGAGPQFYILGNGDFVASYTAIDTAGQTASHPITGPGTGNLYHDPLLLDSNDAPGLDDCWMTDDDGLSPEINSPCVNAGDSSQYEQTDLAMQPRISGVNIDIGPYEFQLPDSVVWSGVENSDWFNAANWSPGRVPDSLQTVTIPGVGSAPNQPVIALDTAYCRNIIVLTDGNLVIQQLLQLK
jgi:hypothetical protein